MSGIVRKKLGPEQQLRAERDLRLIVEFQNGRTEAFDELVRSYETTVHRVLLQLNVQTGDAEDLAQEVFLRVFRNIHRFRGQSSFYTWLYRITINVFFDFNKKRKRADVRQARLQNEVADASNLRPDVDDPFHATYDAFIASVFSRRSRPCPSPSNRSSRCAKWLISPTKRSRCRPAFRSAPSVRASRGPGPASRPRCGRCSTEPPRKRH